MTSRRKILISTVQLLDLAIVATAFVVAIAVTQREQGVDGWLAILEMRVKVQNLLFVLAYLYWWQVVLRLCGLYNSYRLSAAWRELRDLVVAVAVATLPLLLSGLIFQQEYVTVPFLLAFATATFVGLGAERMVLRSVARSLRRRGRNLRSVVIVGPHEVALDLMTKLDRRDDLGYRVVEVVEPAPGANGSGDGGYDAVVERVEALLEQTPIDEIFVALPLEGSQPLVAHLLATCEEQGVTVRVMAHLTSLSLARAIPDALGGQPLLTIYTGPEESPALLAKRGIDIVVSLLGLLLLAPVFLLVAVAVKLDSPGPAFFAQERVGLNRRRFRAYKFRTMVVDAERIQAELESLNEAQGPVFKIASDPRVTRLGRWLRQLSIDELPQLYNVLKGDMSLVGPRPLPVRDVDLIDVRWHKRRFSVKPGITCLWQVDRREPQFDEWVLSDIYYIDHWSLSLDLKILAKTVTAVLSRHGVH